MYSYDKLTVTVLTLLLTATLSGCTSGQTLKPAESIPVKPTLSPSSGSVSSPTPSASAAPISSVSTALPDPNEIQTKLTGFQWVDGKTGFAWGTTNDNLRMYRSDDGGKKWTSVTPKGQDLKTGMPEKGRSLIFLDAQHGWMSAFMQDHPNLTLRTSNGGLEWQNTLLDKTTFPTAIEFISPQLGWLMTSSDAAMGSTEKTLYATQDGGASWNATTQTEFPGNGTQTNTGSLPFGGVTEGISFKDSENGWLALTSHAEVPILYRTKDGGKTWAEVLLLVPKDQSGVPMNITAAPKFFPEDGEHGWFPVRTSAADKRILDAYVTSDGGEHWTLKPFGLQKVITFLDYRQGWGWKDNGLYRTKDAGTTWSRLPANGVLADKLNAYPEPLEIQFVSPENGWLLLGEEDGKKSLLLKTEDGGASWTLV